MNTKFSTRNPVTRAQYPKFFTLLRKAALNLGLDTPQEVEEYSHQVMREEAGLARPASCPLREPGRRIP